MSSQHSILPAAVGQSDHPVPFPPVDQFLDILCRQADSAQPFQFIHGELLHDEFGLIEVDDYIPDLEAGRDYRAVIDSITDYLDRLQTQRMLVIGIDWARWLRFENRRCRRLLEVFLRADR